ncbi:MAG TPA: hypothetical protein DCR14_09950 [Acidimicrobiaceae bacterium]|nr:hypothetical protein [Acidimicrobiaceae bacterium]
MTDTSTSTVDTYLVVDSPYEVTRWRPLVNWVLVIPHMIVLYGLRILAQVVFLVYWVMFIATGRLHPGMYGIMAMHERYNTRASGFLFGFSEVYPPFDFNNDAVDNGAYPPVRLTLPPVPEVVGRGAALNIFKAIPHYIVLAIYFIAAGLVAFIGWFAVLFTGAWPQGMRRFLIQVSNYYYRVWAYTAMVQNDYPKFGVHAA